MSTQTNIRGTDTCPAVSELANKRSRTKPPQPTARGALIVLNGCLELASADDLIRRNPARSKQVKRPPVVLNRSSVWPDEVVAAIIGRRPPRYRLIPIIGAGGGLRQGELFGLTPGDFDFDRHVILVRRQVKRLGSKNVFALPKNEKEREVPMSASIAAAAQQHLEDFGSQPVTLPWKDFGGDLRTVDLLSTWNDGLQLRARSYGEQVWKPVLAAVGVIPPPTRDHRHRKLRYQTDRMAGLHALRASLVGSRAGCFCSEAGDGCCSSGGRELIAYRCVPEPAEDSPVGVPVSRGPEEFCCVRRSPGLVHGWLDCSC